MGFGGVLDIEQLQHGVVEEEAAIGRALAGVAVRGALTETEIDETGCGGGAGSGADKNVIENGGHCCLLLTNRL